MASFVKLDSGILASTLWIDRDARDIFITALLMAEPRELRESMPQIEIHSLTLTGWDVPPGWYGFVPAAGIGIVNRAGVADDIGKAALDRLGKPELESRSMDFDGRRLVRVDGGFVVLNFVKYRERDYTATDRSRRWRKRQKEARVTRSNVTDTAGNGVAIRQGTQAEGEAEIRDQRSEGDPERPPPSRKPLRRIALATLPFLAVYNAYPNKDKKLPAAEIWHEIAGDYVGGEPALRDAVLRWFATGVIKRHPYAGDPRFRPLLETVLAERRWEDGQSAAPADTFQPSEYPEFK